MSQSKQIVKCAIKSDVIYRGAIMVCEMMLAGVAVEPEPEPELEGSCIFFLADCSPHPYGR